MKFVSLIEHKFVISIKQKYKKMLPIALKSFHIKNYQGIIDTQIDDIPADTQWIFLTGENGFGKTSILQGIANKLNDNAWSNNEDEKTWNKEFGLQFHQSENEFIDNHESEGFLIDLGMYNEYRVETQFVAYGAIRLRVSAGFTTEVIKKNSQTSSLFSNETLLSNIEEKFKDWKSNYPKGFNLLETIFKTLIPNFDKITVEYDEKERISKVKYYEKDSEGNVYKDGFEFLELATGYKTIIAMIGDMFIRLSKNHALENSKDLEGIVIIDEFELHLHAKYQKLFVQKLTELFPKIQFIVSTHSPIPLLGAPPNSVIINVSRTREEGIKAELLDYIDFSVLTPNSILSSPIFGFQDLIPESKTKDKMARSEDSYKEVLFNDLLDKQIDEYLTDENKQELLDLLKIK
jgi:predicted ATP-binding protein involved in virulence